MKLLKALQCQRRVETQWGLLVERVVALEDTHRNAASHDTTFKHSTPPHRHPALAYIFTPTLGNYILYTAEKITYHFLQLSTYLSVYL